MKTPGRSIPGLVPWLALAGLLLAQPGLANRVIMSWDQIDPSEGDAIAVLEIDGDLEVPPEACGFRLGLHGHDWTGGWHFGTYGNIGNPLVRHGVLYSSANPNIGQQGPIEATGPVGACAGSNYAYNFITPLAGPFGVVGDAPLHGSPSAGSFVADVYDGTHLEWLDFAGNAIAAPKPGKPDPKPPKLPPEFIGESPGLANCIRDFDNTYHCDDSAQAAHRSRPGLRATRAGRAAAEQTVAHPGIISAAMTVMPASTQSGLPADGIACPASLVLNGTIHRNPAFQPDPDEHADYALNPPVVEYRFYFVPEHVASTRFTVALSEPETAVSHIVPIPLPPPIGDPAAGGITPGATRLAVATRPDGPTPPGRGLTLDDAVIVADTGPDHVHQGTVRLQLTNIVAANGQNVQVSSAPASYRIECRQDGPEPSYPVLTTPVAQPPPARPGRMTPASGAGMTCEGGTVRNQTCTCSRGLQPVRTGEHSWRCLPIRRGGG